MTAWAALTARAEVAPAPPPGAVGRAVESAARPAVVVVPSAVAAAPSWALRGVFALLLIFAVREAQPLLTPVLVAVVLTFVLAPLVRRLRKLGVPEVLGAALVVVALLASTVPLALSLAQPAAQWWEQAPTTVAQLLARFDRLRAAIPGLAPPAPVRTPAPALRGGNRTTVAANPAPAVPAVDPVRERLASEGLALTGTLLSHGVSFSLAAATTLILLYFLLASEHWMLSRCVEAVPRRRTRALILGGVRAAQREIGRYLFATGCINVVSGLAAALAMWLLGVSNPTLWGVLVAVLSFVPYLGPLLIMGLLLLAGMTTASALPGMLTPVFAYAAIHAVESNFVSPWVVGRRLSLSPISVFLAVVFWGWVWGIAGALIAVPMLIALRTVCLRVRRLRKLARFLEGDRRLPPSLRSLLRRPRAGVGAGAGAAEAPRRQHHSQAVDMAQAGVVHVLTPAVAAQAELVVRPLEHQP